MAHFSTVTVLPGLNTPAENPCKLLQFSLLVLEAGETYRALTQEREFIAVLLSGHANFSVSGSTFENVGMRKDVFSGLPHAMYLPAGVDYDIKASDVLPQIQIALISAPSALKVAPTLITSADTGISQQGAANFARKNMDILTPYSQPHIGAQRLLVGETWTPSGNWGIYPPHRHNMPDFPNESDHETMYFMRINPGEGFGIFRYFDEQEGDHYCTIQDSTLVMCPKGYHSYVVAPGYEAYTLWFMAGDDRNPIYRTEPAHEWIEKAVPLLQQV